MEYFSSSHVCTFLVVMSQEGWAPKNCFFQAMVLEKTVESSLDSNEIKLVNPKGN